MHPQRLSEAALRPAPDRWIFIGLLALLAWLPLPWGTHTPASMALLGFVATILAAALELARGLGRIDARPLTVSARIALGLWVAWLTWIAFQVLPLPDSVLGFLSRPAQEIHAAVAGVPGARPWSSISITPGDSVDQLLLSFGYFSLFWLVLATVRGDRARQRLLLLTLVAIGVAEALYASIMTLSGLEYGFFAKKTYDIGWATGTFVNRNHLAGYLELTLSAGLAVILADLHPDAGTATGWRARLENFLELAMSRRLRVRALLVVMVVALVLTRSRMGNLAFFIALALCGSGYIFVRHKQLFARSLILFVTVFLVDLWIVSQRFGLEQVAQRIQATDVRTEQRAQVLLELDPVVRKYFWAGAGLGTFAAAYSPVQTDQVQGYYDHAHNDHLELIIETGIVGYALLVALAACVVIHGILVVLRRHDPRACALGFVGPMGIACLAIHGTADFNLHIPAVAATLVALMALSLSCSFDSRRGADRRAEPSSESPEPAL